MKRIEAIVRAEKLEFLRKALEEVGYSGIMITDIVGHGRGKGIIQRWKGKTYKVELLPRKKVEIIAKDDDVEKILRAIVESTRTGEKGNGKIFVADVEDALRIRTGERGNDAI